MARGTGAAFVWPCRSPLAVSPKREKGENPCPLPGERVAEGRVRGHFGCGGATLSRVPYPESRLASFHTGSLYFSAMR
jgi:hypothetical protein